jgi:hypothetical protein
MNVFWRQDELTPGEAKLLEAVLTAHHASTQRDNISTIVLKSTFQGSWSFQQALAAAILTFGGAHGPVEQTMALLDNDHVEKAVQETLGLGLKVTGWGSSVEDDIWQGVGDRVLEGWPVLGRRIRTVTRLLHESGKMVEPNPSCWTAAMNIALGVPRHLALWPVLQGRLSGWAEILL